MVQGHFQQLWKCKTKHFSEKLPYCVLFIQILTFKAPVTCTQIFSQNDHFSLHLKKYLKSHMTTFVKISPSTRHLYKCSKTSSPNRKDNTPQGCLYGHVITINVLSLQTPKTWYWGCDYCHCCYHGYALAHNRNEDIYTVYIKSAQKL